MVISSRVILLFSKEPDDGSHEGPVFSQLGSMGFIESWSKHLAQGNAKQLTIQNTDYRKLYPAPMLCARMYIYTIYGE